MKQSRCVLFEIISCNKHWLNTILFWGNKSAVRPCLTLNRMLELSISINCTLPANGAYKFKKNVFQQTQATPPPPLSLPHMVDNFCSLFANCNDRKMQQIRVFDLKNTILGLPLANKTTSSWVSWPYIAWLKPHKKKMFFGNEKFHCKVVTVWYP